MFSRIDPYFARVALGDTIDLFARDLMAVCGFRDDALRILRCDPHIGARSSGCAITKRNFDFDSLLQDGSIRSTRASSIVARWNI